MAEAKTAVAHKPVWVDLSSQDAEGSREFYAKLFGWKLDVNPDPQYGGYAMAKIGSEDVAGIGPAMAKEQPTAWTVYIASANAADIAQKAEAAGGKIAVAPMEVGGQGTMVVIQDPTGALLGVWQPKEMSGFKEGAANSFGWAELNARGIDKAKPFYTKVFDWGLKKSEIGAGQPEYTEFLANGESIAGGQEMHPMVPDEVPSYWLVYFNVDDVDKSFKKAIDSGAREMLAAQDFPGGRFAIVSDPQGAAFGLLKTKDQG